MCREKEEEKKGEIALKRNPFEIYERQHFTRPANFWSILYEYIYICDNR